MRKIILSLFFAIASLSIKAQSDINNIALEIQGQNVILVSSLKPIQGSQLFYSKNIEKVIDQNDPDFASDRSILIIKPLIRIFKKSEMYPDNNTMSLTFQTSEIVDGVEIRNTIDCNDNIRLIKINKWTKKDALNYELVIGNIEEVYMTLRISLNPSGSYCILSKSYEKVLNEVLLMKRIKLTILDGKKIN